MKHMNLYDLVKRMALAALVITVLFGCNPQQPQEVVTSEPEAVTIEAPEQEVVFSPESESAVIEKGDPGTVIEKGDPGTVIEKGDLSKRLEQYDAMIEATDTIKLGMSGVLKVWMGKEKYMPKANAGFARDTTSWYSYAGLFARITPDAKGFKIEPEGPVVVKLDSTGSGFQFAITPEAKGEYKVSAIIELFENEACLGTPVIKPTQTLSVKVRVDYFDEIWMPVWNAFKRFWVAFVALGFGALLFVSRKFIKKKTGYGDDKYGQVIEDGNDKAIENKNEEPEIAVEEESEVPDEEYTEETPEVVDEETEIPNEETEEDVGED